MTRLEELQQDAARVGMFVRTYSPGDGVTRYRFFRISDTEQERQTYFGPANGAYTALGIKEAETYLAGVFA